MNGPTVRRVLLALAMVSAVIVVGGVVLWGLGGGRWTLGDSLYMSVITVSTVGFAELPGIDRVRFARGATVLIILGGLGTVAFFQSAMTALIVEGAIGNAWRRNRMKKLIDGLSGHVVVAGVGSTGRHVVEELLATATPFVVIERNAANVERLEAELGRGRVLFVHGDATEDHTLLEAGISRAKGVIAALTHDRDNLFVTLSARALNADARIVSKVVEPEAVPKMKRAGADATVSPNIIGGRRMASELIRPEVVEFLDQMLRDKDRNLRLEEVAVSAGSPYVGHALRDVPIRKQTNVLVVAVRDASRAFKYNPGPDTLLEADTMLVVLGETTDIVTLRTLLGVEPSPMSRRGLGRIFRVHDARAVASGTAGEGGEQLRELRCREAPLAVRELERERFVERHVEPVVRREAIVSHARLREERERARELFRRGERLAARYDLGREPDRERFLRPHRAAGEDEIERPPEPDDPWQSRRPAVDEGHPEAATEHAERRVRRDDAEIAKACELEPARDRVPLDRRDDRLRERHPRRPHRAVPRLRDAVAALGADRLEIGTCTERPCGAGEDRDRERVGVFESPKRVREGGGRRPVDRVLRRGAIDRHDHDRAFDLVTYRHTRTRSTHGASAWSARSAIAS